MIANTAFSQPPPAAPTAPSRKTQSRPPPPMTPSKIPEAMITDHWIAKSKNAAMKRDPMPASVSSTSTPSGVAIRTRSSYSIVR